MEQEQVKGIIEALLFASEKPLTIAQIKEVLEEADAAIIKAQILQLNNDYKESGRSFNITEIAGGYQISTDSQYAPWLKKLYRKARTEKLSRPSLETLAIIAYRQPITRLEIEDIRGVSVDGVLRTLLDKSLVRISGRKPIAGRPFFYITTRQFLEFFGLQSLDGLPQLGEFEDAGLELEKHAGVDSIEGGGKQDGKTKEITQEDRPG